MSTKQPVDTPRSRPRRYSKGNRETALTHGGHHAPACVTATLPPRPASPRQGAKVGGRGAHAPRLDGPVKISVQERFQPRLQRQPRCVQSAPATRWVRTEACAAKAGHPLVAHTGNRARHDAPWKRAANSRRCCACNRRTGSGTVLRYCARRDRAKTAGVNVLVTQPGPSMHTEAHHSGGSCEVR